MRRIADAYEHGPFLSGFDQVHKGKKRNIHRSSYSEGCLTKDENVRFHSCETSQPCQTRRNAPCVVDIVPAVSMTTHCGGTNEEYTTFDLELGAVHTKERDTTAEIATKDGR